MESKQTKTYFNPLTDTFPEGFIFSNDINNYCYELRQYFADMSLEEVMEEKRRRFKKLTTEYIGEVIEEKERKKVNELSIYILQADAVDTVQMIAFLLLTPESENVRRYCEIAVIDGSDAAKDEPFSLASRMEIVAQLIAKLGAKDLCEKAVKDEALRVYSLGQSKKAKLAAAARYGDRRPLNEILEKLAHRHDDWGPIPANDLWSEFYSELDGAGLHPNESTSNTNSQNRITWKDSQAGMTYGTFKNKISELRGKHNSN